MARKAGVTRFIYVIDTSYLTELFEVPGYSENQAKQHIINRFRTAAENGSMVVVPIPCLFELADHIGDVKDGKTRRRLARDVTARVNSSVERGTPWIITPAAQIDLLAQFQAALVAFSSVAHPRGFGLTDAFVVREASRLRERYGASGYHIHIWTRDRHLKSREPDREDNAYL